MKKAAILDPNAKKKLKFWALLALFKKKVFKKTFSSNGNYLTLESLKYHLK